MVQLVSSINSRGQENPSSEIEVKPKKNCKAVTLRSGKQLGQVSGETMVGDENKIEHEEVDNPALGEQSDKEPNRAEIESTPPPVKPYVLPIPFSQRLKQNILDK